MMLREAARLPGPRPKLVHHVPVASGRYDLSREINELRSSPQYLATGHAARTLFKRRETRAVLIVLAQGSALAEHQVNRPVSIHTLEGRISVRGPEGWAEQLAGGLQLLDPAVAHDVEALSNSAILLTIPWPDPLT